MAVLHAVAFVAVLRVVVAAVVMAGVGRGSGGVGETSVIAVLGAAALLVVDVLDAQQELALLVGADGDGCVRQAVVEALAFGHDDGDGVSAGFALGGTADVHDGERHDVTEQVIHAGSRVQDEFTGARQHEDAIGVGRVKVEDAVLQLEARRTVVALTDIDNGDDVALLLGGQFLIVEGILLAYSRHYSQCSF